MARAKKLGVDQIQYKPVEENTGAFAKFSNRDLIFDEDHDEVVWKSFCGYDYSKKQAFPKNKQLAFSAGIVDKASTQKFLGKNMNKRCVLLRNSVAFSGKREDWESLHIFIALEVVQREVAATSEYKFVPVRVASVIDIVPRELRIAIISLLAHEGAYEGSKLEKVPIPAQFLRYAVIPGSDLANSTKE
jgi:hypothetical protein